MNQNQKPKFNWPLWIRDTLTQLLKSVAVKAALSRLATWSIISIGGFRAWVAKFLIEFAFDKLVVPVVRLCFRKLMFKMEVEKGEIKLKKLKKARIAGEKDNYVDILSSV